MLVDGGGGGGPGSSSHVIAAAAAEAVLTIDVWVTDSATQMSEEETIDVVCDAL